MPACICAPEDCRGDKAEPGWGELYWGIWGFLCMYPAHRREKSVSANPELPVHTRVPGNSPSPDRILPATACTHFSGCIKELVLSEQITDPISCFSQEKNSLVSQQKPVQLCKSLGLLVLGFCSLVCFPRVTTLYLQPRVKILHAFFPPKSYSLKGQRHTILL